MAGDLELRMSNEGMLSGFPYHDGRLIGIDLSLDRGAVTIEGSDGSRTVLELHGVIAMQCIGDMRESIVGYIFVRHVSETADPTVRALMESAGGGDISAFVESHPDSVAVSIESLMGTDVVVLCQSISAHHI